MHCQMHALKLFTVLVLSTIAQCSKMVYSSAILGLILHLADTLMEDFLEESSPLYCKFYSEEKICICYSSSMG